jgi:hypothetical protein
MSKVSPHEPGTHHGTKPNIMEGVESDERALVQTRTAHIFCNVTTTLVLCGSNLSVRL